MRFKRFFFFLAVTFLSMPMTMAPGYCRIKIKLPISIKVEPISSVAQESALNRGVNSSAKNNLKNVGYDTKIEPVQCVSSGNSENSGVTDDEVIKEISENPELSFSLLSETNINKEAEKESEYLNEGFKVKRCPVDFSTIVEKKDDKQNEEKNEQNMLDMSHVRAFVTKLNDNVFNYCKDNSKLISYLNSLGELNPQMPLMDKKEAGKIVQYHGFSMTKRTAQCFNVLEELIKRRFPGRKIEITCTTGGYHLDAKHYQGKAVDFVVHGLTIKESFLVETLSEQAGFTVFNEYVYSSPYKTGDHMHIDLVDFQ